MKVRCQLDKVQDFVIAHKQDIILHGFEYRGVSYVPNDMCKQLIQSCVIIEDDQNNFADKWEVREPTPFENKIENNIGDVVVVPCTIYLNDLEPEEGKYIITQNGSFMLQGVSINQTINADPEVLSFVHNVALVLQRFQQLIPI